MATVYVLAGNDLQAAIDNAVPGDTLELEAGATWSGDLLFREKSGEGEIILTAPSDRLPAAGNRITEEQSHALPRLIGNHKTSPRAAGYTLRGLRIEAYANSYTGGSLDLGGSGINGDIVVSRLEDLPREWMVEHCFLQADKNAGGKRGIAANCIDLTVRDSVIQGYWSDGQDTQAIGGWNGPGPFTIHNCLLEASGENVMFGGACPAIPNLIPSDIDIEGCWFYKPLSWKTTGQTAGVEDPGPLRMRRLAERPRLIMRNGVATFSEYSVKVKNLFELKNAQRVRVRHCILENNWASAQAGYGIQLTVRTCEAGDYSWACVNDVLIEECQLLNSDCGINVLGMDGARGSCGDPPYAGEARNIVIAHNLIQASWVFQFLSGVQGITIESNSCDQNYGGMMTMDSAPDIPQMTGLNCRHNSFQYGSGISGTSAGPGKQALDMYFAQYDFSGNAIWGIPSSEMWWIANPDAGWYPPDNVYTDAQQPVAGYGCDKAALEAQLKHVRDGQTAGTTPPNPEPGPAATLYVDIALPSGEYMVVPV